MLRGECQHKNVIELAVGDRAPFAAEDALAVLRQDFGTIISLGGDWGGHVHLNDSGVWPATWLRRGAKSLYASLGQHTLEEYLTTGVIVALAAIAKNESKISLGMCRKTICIRPIGWQEDPLYGTARIRRYKGPSKPFSATRGRHPSIQ
jgi:hypothetical protein